MATLFTKIIEREIPAHFLYEDEVCVVILDKFPTVRGQTLVIPKQEVEYAFDLDDTTYAHLMQVAKRVTRALDAVFSTERTCLVIEGFEVPHTHIKLYPMQAGDTNLGTKLTGGTAASDDDLAAIATRIKHALAGAS